MLYTCKVGQNHIYTVYEPCIYGVCYGVIGRETIKYMVIYGVYIQFWPTLYICSSMLHMLVYIWSYDSAQRGHPGASCLPWPGWCKISRSDQLGISWNVTNARQRKANAWLCTSICNRGRNWIRLLFGGMHTPVHRRGLTPDLARQVAEELTEKIEGEYETGDFWGDCTHLSITGVCHLTWLVKSPGSWKIRGRIWNRRLFGGLHASVYHRGLSPDLARQAAEELTEKTEGNYETGDCWGDCTHLSITGVCHLTWLVKSPRSWQRRTQCGHTLAMSWALTLMRCPIHCR